MEQVLLHHLTYALAPAVTVLWGESLRSRLLYRGARRAVRLLIAALLVWQFVRLMKYMLEPVAEEPVLKFFWYLFYVFRAALPVALLWIAHVADADAVAWKMPRHLVLLLLVNLILAVGILTNDWHEQVFSFPPEREGQLWEEKLEWGAYAYWVIWFLEILLALMILWTKAGLQSVRRIRMLLPFALLVVFLLYSVFYNFIPMLRIDVTFTTTGFFLVLLELCLRTGLIASNHEYEAFFRQASLGLMLLDAEDRVRLASKAVPSRDTDLKEYRISRMRLADGGALVWYENLQLLHERQHFLARANRALQRRNLYRKHTAVRRKKRAIDNMQEHLHREVEEILTELRPYFRQFREDILHTEGRARVQAVHKLNLLATYTKKRCVLFLKSEEDGRIALDELEMASSELCAAARLLDFHVAVSWQLPEALPAWQALMAFDALSSFLAEAAHGGTAMTAYVTMNEAHVTFLLEEAVPWFQGWRERWQDKHAKSELQYKELGFAVSICCPLQ